MALLRVDGVQVYLAFLALWLPLLLLAAAAIFVFPDYGGFAPLVVWWLRPLLERAPLYVLSRNVFGEKISWRQAVRAWPSLLRGGWFRLLTWWRFFLPNRGLYQPIWLLEGLRGKAAADRRRIIGRDGGQAAYWFGLACAHFELILQLGFIAFIGFFLSEEHAINPFAFFWDIDNNANTLWNNLSLLICYGVAVAIIAPMYTACCFTLYLNRRATLEAWDVELMLRQLTPPPSSATPSSAIVAGLLPLFLLGMLLHSPASHGNESALACEKPDYLVAQQGQRSEAHNETQQQLREQLDAVYQHEDLLGYRCVQTWVLKNQEKKKKKSKEKIDAPDLSALAAFLKVLLIALGIGLLAWLLYRYREYMPRWFIPERRFVATEVSGMDIRPESLPDDICAEVNRLWAAGQQRAALALLYRATISRLVNEYHVRIGRGATEQDCVRYAERAATQQQISADCLRLCKEVTTHWLNGAYGQRWLHSETLVALLHRWQQQFEPASAELGS